MASINKITAITIATEVLIFTLVAVITFLLAYNKLGVQPFRRGFFCDDQSISYPYHDDTISDTLAAIIFVGIPVIIMIAVESIHLMTSKEHKIKGKKHTCIALTVEIYKTVGAFLFGVIATLCLTETMKVFAGRLRPHFLSVCDPDLTKVNCSHGYITVSDNDCKGTDEKKLIDARKSFPSGHSSITAFGALYFIIYLYFRFVWPRRVRIFVPTLQTLVAVAAAYVCISRVSDNKHHFSDVISGAILGTIMAVLIVKYVSCLKKCRSSNEFSLDSGISPSNTEEKQLSTLDGHSVASTVVEMKSA